MKLSLAIGEKKDGSFKVLYIGTDADKAKAAALDSKDMVRSAWYKNPVARQRRSFQIDNPAPPIKP